MRHSKSNIAEIVEYWLIRHNCGLSHRQSVTNSSARGLSGFSIGVKHDVRLGEQICALRLRQVFRKKFNSIRKAEHRHLEAYRFGEF